jgi:CheY-like chemotaxis protein
MRITSQIGIGTQVELWLPVSEADIVEPARLPEPPCLKEIRYCRVLVVEDDPIVASGTVAMLEDLGHSAIEAASGEAALRVLRSDRGIDVVITDHAMPGMTGTELACSIRRDWPDLPVIIATGYAELPANTDLKLPRLSKPYRQQELDSLLNSVIGKNPVAPSGSTVRNEVA